MNTLWIHIGLSKCGSTALQFLLMNVPLIESLKRQANIEISDFGAYLWRKVLEECAHNGMTEEENAVEYFNRTGKLELTESTAFFKSQAEKAASSPYHQTIWSAEGISDQILFGTGDAQDSWLSEAVGSIEQPVNIGVVMYVRRQDTYVESFYSHIVKRGYKEPFDVFFEFIKRLDLSWCRLADSLQEVPGISEVKVIPYDGDLLQVHREMNFYEAFFDALGHRLQIGVDFDDRKNLKNPTLAPDLLEVASFINKSLPPQRAKEVNEVLAESFPKSLSGTHSLLSSAQRSEFLARYAESNRQLFLKYIPWAPMEAYEQSATPVFKASIG